MTGLTFEDEKTLNPFDFCYIANFKLKIRKVDELLSNYDKSEFESPSKLAEDDDKIENNLRNNNLL